jgi:hypothetical protein
MTVSAKALTVPAKNYTDKATKLAISRPWLQDALEGREAAKKALISGIYVGFRGMIRKWARSGKKNKWCPEEDSNLHALASAST